jgi:hypothetical protein
MLLHQTFAPACETNVGGGEEFSTGRRRSCRPHANYCFQRDGETRAGPAWIGGGGGLTTSASGRRPLI